MYLNRKNSLCVINKSLFHSSSIAFDKNVDEVKDEYAPQPKLKKLPLFDPAFGKTDYKGAKKDSSPETENEIKAVLKKQIAGEKSYKHAVAIFKEAALHSAIATVRADFEDISNLINTRWSYRTIFKDPLTGDKERREGLKTFIKTYGSEYHPITVQALKNLNKINALPMITSITETLTKVAKDYLSEIDIVITTSRDDPDTVKRVEEETRSRLPKRSVPTFYYKIDPALLDGYTVKVDGNIVEDASYRDKLEGQAAKYLEGLYKVKKELTRKRDFMNNLSIAPAARTKGLWQELLFVAQSLDVVTPVSQKQAVVSGAKGAMKISQEKIKAGIEKLSDVYDFKKETQ